MFTCNKRLINKYMKYFSTFLEDFSETKEIDITVYCDIKIFEWLISYVHQREKLIRNGKLVGFASKHIVYRKRSDEEKKNEKTTEQSHGQPVLDLKNVISVLISSEFLSIQELVQESISYVISNLHDIVRLPIDMNCLSDNLVLQIAEQLPMDKLNSLYDKRDKLTSRLFKAKL